MDDKTVYEEDVIDLYELFMMFIEHIREIILCFLIGAVIFNAYAFFGVHPTYQSTSKMYIVSSSTDSLVDLTDLNIGTSLTGDYQELVLSYPVVKEVLDNLKLEYSVEDFKKMVSITNPTDTRVLYITCTSTDATEARDIANEMMNVAINYLPETMSTSAPNVAEYARIAERKSGPSYLKYTAMGAMLGAILYLAYLTILFLLDDTVHTSEDMEKYFDITPLAVIPEADVLGNIEVIKKKKKGRSLWKR